MCLLQQHLLQPHQDSLTEVEEKYKKAMVSNAQLDNDKGNLIYQVDTLKDVIEEMEESMSEMKRELEEKTKVSRRRKAPSLWEMDFLHLLFGFQELERQKHTCSVLQHKQEELKEGIRQRDELIEVRLLLQPHQRVVQSPPLMVKMPPQEFDNHPLMPPPHPRLSLFACPVKPLSSFLSLYYC